MHFATETCVLSMSCSVCLLSREVCKRLGMGHLIPGFQAMTSPTKELINYFEVSLY